MTSTRHLGWTSLVLLALVGCDAPVEPKAEPGPTTTPTTTPTPTPEAPKDKTEVKSIPVEGPKGAAAPKLSDEEIAEVKKLAPEDQAIALAQVTCPVSDEKLGEMGVPIKQVVDGKTFFICCASCEKTVKNDPASVLAKLKK